VDRQARDRLLNQTGPGRGRERDALDESSWSAHLAAHVGTHRVMALDAFARCWVQEDVLLASVERVIGAERKDAFARLRAAWRTRNLKVFDEAMGLLASQLATAATDREALPQAAGGIVGLARETRRLVASIAGNAPKEDAASQAAMSALAQRLDPPSARAPIGSSRCTDSRAARRTRSSPACPRNSR
jgi:hypothetical protein